MATNFNDYLNEQLKDECFRTEYDLSLIHI